jgi:F0F1-type ATP synthase delta subunit
MAKTSRTKLAKATVDLLEHHPAKQVVAVVAAELVKQKLTGQLDLLMRDVSAELLARSGQLELDVVSAHKLTDKIRRELETVVRAETGAKTVTLSEHLDESVVGGLVARASDLEINMTIDDKLRRLAA